MINERSRVAPDLDGNAAVAEFIRTKGVTRCPTACVLPTQASLAASDRQALGEYAARRAQLRRERVIARAQRLWDARVEEAELEGSMACASPT
jgi:hypothetical protein